MLNILSVGITSTHQAEDCPSAKNDSINIYKCFKKISAKNFDITNSICLIDAKVNAFKDILSEQKKLLNKDDIMIIFYSGHASIEDDTLHLHFKDDDLEITEFKHLLAKSPAHFILIFDCCYAGVASFLARKNSLFGKSNISVVLSCNSTDASYYINDISNFTEYFIKHLWHCMC